MKKTIILLIALAFPLMALTQPLSVRKLFHRYGQEEGVTRITVPGVAIRLATCFVDDDETARLLKGIRKVKVLVAEGEDNLPDPEFTAKIIRDFENSRFEEMLTVQDDGDQVGIYIRDIRRNKKELVIFTRDKKESAVIYLKGKMTPELLHQLSSNPGPKSLSQTITL